MNRSMQLHYICHGFLVDRVIFRINFTGMRLPWECHDQSQETNLISVRHWTGTACLSQKKRHAQLKIGQSVKMP